MTILPSATEKEICYWCETCNQFVLPDQNHNGEQKQCAPRVMPKIKASTLLVDRTKYGYDG